MQWKKKFLMTTQSRGGGVKTLVVGPLKKNFIFFAAYLIGLFKFKINFSHVFNRSFSTIILSISVKLREAAKKVLFLLARPLRGGGD